MTTNPVSPEPTWHANRPSTPTRTYEQAIAEAAAAWNEYLDSKDWTTSTVTALPERAIETKPKRQQRAKKAG
ncbi:hypothetical protein [Dactylosporangium sp. NPDC051484]|uniref:hypothetical protein n=1 Tax=Dactylosporangium sp. NPDC051484 TaxID=3154942 RepID=UPI00344E7262